MNIYVISRSTKGEPREPVTARYSLDDAKRYCNDTWYVGLYRDSPSVCKGTWNGFDEVWVHKVDLPDGAS